jgi:hypothetical protein
MRLRRGLAGEDEGDGLIELVVFALVLGGRHVGRNVRRLALGALVVFERVGQAGLAVAGGAGFQLGDVLVRQADLGDFEVRLDAGPWIDLPDGV